jgi:putative phosphoribosyl transferase
LISRPQRSTPTLDAIVAQEQGELERRERAYRGNRSSLKLRGRTVILVDDGIATGTSMRAAVIALQQQQPAELILAAPVAARSSCAAFNGEHQTCVCLSTPEPFNAVGLWYQDFAQTTDEEVCELLAQVDHTTPLLR